MAISLNLLYNSIRGCFKEGNLVEENQDIHAKRKKNKWLIVLIPILLILSIFFFSESIRNKTLDFLDSLGNGEKELSLINSLDSDGILDMGIYDGTMALWKENKISFLNKDGEILGEKNFEFTDPSIYFGKNRIYPFDKATGNIYFLEKNGEGSKEVNLNKEIFSIKEKNEKLLCHLKVEGKEILDILSENRVSIGSMDFEEKNILAYDANSRGTNILVSLLNLKDNKLRSEVYNYTENAEELAFLKIDEEVVLFNQLVDNSSQIILTDRALYYVRSSKVIWEREFNLIKDIYLDNDIYILHGNYLEVIDLEGESKSKTGFTEAYTSIVKFDRSTLVYGEENLGLVKNGELLLEHKEPILKVYGNQKDIIILGPEAINIYELIDKK